LSESLRLVREICSAGASPNNTPLNSETGENERRRVDPDFLEPGQVPRFERQQQVHPPHSQQQPQQAARNREQQAFSQQLPNQSEPRSAHRGADGDLTLARGGARQKQVRDVARRYQKDESDGHQ
jgi:hypothetical protein